MYSHRVQHKSLGQRFAAFALSTSRCGFLCTDYKMPAPHGNTHYMSSKSTRDKPVGATEEMPDISAKPLYGSWSHRPLASVPCNLFVQETSHCGQISETPQDVLENDPSSRTKLSLTGLPTFPPLYFTIRSGPGEASTPSSFVPATGFDRLTGSQLYQLVELHPLPTLPLKPEIVVSEKKHLLTKVPFLSRESSPLIPSLNIDQPPTIDTSI